MRILQVVHWFLPRHVAGSEIYTYQLAQALRARHEVAIFCREDGHPEAAFYEEDDVHNGLAVHRVYHNPPTGPAGLLRKALARFHNPQVERSFRRYVQCFRPDIVHFQHLFKLSASLIALTRNLGIPTVITLHDYWLLCYNGQLLRPGLRVCRGPLGGLRCPGCAELAWPSVLRPLAYPLLWPFFLYRTRVLRRALRRADVIFSPSARLADVFARHGFPAGRILVCDYGVNTSWTESVQRIPHPRLRFGYIGTIAPHKGLHVLLDAFNQLESDRAELRIYGDPTTVPSYTAKLREMANESVVRFLGPFNHDELARVFSDLDVLVVPSVWPENSPLTIHEARAARVPVLASDIGGMSELVRKGRAGWLFRAGDAADLARQMRKILDAPEVLTQVRAEVRPVKSIAEHAAELETIYARLAAQA